MAIQGRPRVRIGDGQLGHVEVTIGVGSPDRSRFIDVQATADTGATFSMLPRRVLRDLGVTSGSTERFQLADGTPVTRDVAEVPVRIEGRVRITPCILGEDGEPALVGVVTLEQFLLGGPLYCDNCYEKAPACTDCGWHIDTKRFAEHHRQVHRD